MASKKKPVKKVAKLERIFVGQKFAGVTFSTDFWCFIKITPDGYFDFRESMHDQYMNKISPDNFEIAFILDWLSNQFRTPEMAKEIIKFKVSFLGEDNNNGVKNPLLD